MLKRFVDFDEINSRVFVFSVLEEVGEDFKLLNSFLIKIGWGCVVCILKFLLYL